MGTFSSIEFYTGLGCSLVIWGVTLLVLHFVRILLGYEFSQPVKAVFFVPFIMTMSFICSSLFGF